MLISHSKCEFVVLAISALIIVSGCDGSDDSSSSSNPANTVSGYPVVDTGQRKFYDDSSVIAAPADNAAFYGQDAQINGNQPNYTLGADGLTIYDNVTGLTWTKSPDWNKDGSIGSLDKMSFSQANSYPGTLNNQAFGGYSDWRLPTMKELYSLMNFSGTDPSGTGVNANTVAFIDTNYFDFAYGDTGAGEREIDAQFWSSSAYVDYVFGNQSAAFGLNLADGRIKGYPSNTMNGYVYFVRGNTTYGTNSFVDNGDSTVSDTATNLMWMKDDSGSGMNWEDALAYAQTKNAANYLGYNDWRLPNAKELHTLMDYSLSPETSNTASIDSVFNVTAHTNEKGESDYPWYWSSTTHATSDGSGSTGVYFCFGRCMGYFNSSWLDVHGAGAQRSDPKSGSLSDYGQSGLGYYSTVAPQGDAVRILNYVRLVRDI